MEPCDSIFSEDLPVENAYSKKRISNKNYEPAVFLCPSRSADPMITEGSFYDE